MSSNSGTNNHNNNNNKTTYSNQELIPPLPISPLHDTLSKYLESVRCVVSTEEFEETKRIVDNFQKPGGDGEYLHAKLKSIAEKLWNTEQTSWLSYLWPKYAYLTWPDPLFTSSAFASFENTPVSVPQTLQAARYVKFVMNFRGAVKREEIAPQYLGTTPLCMNMFKSIFMTERIPGENEDTIARLQGSSVVIVISRKQFYALETVDPVTGEDLTISDLEAQIGRILYESKTSPPPIHGMGVFTADRRPNWAKIREEMLKNKTNKHTLDTIAHAMAVICLDEKSPATDEELGYLCVTDNPHNRWYDKLYQFIVYTNGRVGLILEHAPVDATIFSNIIGQFLKELDLSIISIPPKRTLPAPTKLEWDIAYMADTITQGVITAEKNISSITSVIDYKMLPFCDYGVAWLRAMGISADSLMQVAIQLAYSKIYGRGTPTYQSVYLRKFRDGRTEMGRSFSVVSEEFVRAMNNVDSTMGYRCEAFYNAMEYHKQTIRSCADGKGIDRHLLAYRIFAYEEMLAGERDKMPEFFLDKAYTLSSTGFKLSTAGVVDNYYHPGFLPMVNDGYGISYCMRQNCFIIVITSYSNNNTTSSDRLRTALNTSLKQIKCLILHNAAVKIPRVLQSAL